MAFDDLRSFLKHLEGAQGLHRIPVEVDWDLEVGTILRKVFDQRGPALMFEQVRDSHYPLVAGVMDTYERYAAGIGAEPTIRGILRDIRDRIKNPMASQLVEDAVCQEEVYTGEQIDITKFPSPKWGNLDGGRYLGTLGLVINKDPETGVQNVGIYRLEVKGKNILGYNATQQTGLTLRKYERMGKPMPIAVAIGVDPATLAASCFTVPYGVDELSLAGPLLGHPLQVVKCKTVDLEVPATAEIILEGTVSPRLEDWREEGPFGEFTGYYGIKTRNPFIQLTALTHRHDPILQGTLEGKPPNESTTLRAIGHTLGTWQKLDRSGLPGIKEVYCTDMGCCNFRTIVAIDRQYYHGHARQVIEYVWATGFNHKWTIVVDEDIDIYDRAQVEWALSTRVQPHRDVIVTDQSCIGCNLDPSIPPEDRPYPGTRSSRIGINATTEYKGFEFPPMVQPRDEDFARVESRWREYGFVD
ncbi:MAG: UbiD family decarboxylase [Deltaproteobacteria bacterium]|nr:UbiD family decarboxylase [Deltaproteobacteria bacterium]